MFHENYHFKHVLVTYSYIDRLFAESISQAHQNAAEKYEIERVSWLKSQEKLQSELQELRNKLSQERYCRSFCEILFVHFVNLYRLSYFLLYKQLFISYQ